METLSKAMDHASIATTVDLYGHLDLADVARDLALIESGHGINPLQIERSYGRRRGPDSNRCTRLCRPLPNLSATAPPRLPSYRPQSRTWQEKGFLRRMHARRVVRTLSRG